MRPTRSNLAALMLTFALANARTVFAQPAPDANPAADAAPARTFGGVDEAHILEQIRTARIHGSRRFGNTSVSFRLRLDADVDAGFVPRGEGQWEAWRSEVAAYRINRMLGIARVPPAAPRTVRRASLGIADDPRVAGDPVRGAVIYWVPVLHDSRLESQGERARWEPTLRQATPLPPDQSARAEEISTMIVFDALIGNWDRWSGSNVSIDGDGHLLYRDNDGAFIAPLGRRLTERVIAPVRSVERFSRGVMDRARALTADTIRQEMTRDSDTGRSVLTDAQIAGVLARRDQIVAHVDALVQRYGEAAVYPWP